MREPIPELRKVILEPVYLSPPDLVEAEAEPLLDDTGNLILDDEGRVIYA